MPGQSDDKFIYDYLTKWGQTLIDSIRDNLVSKDSWYDQSRLAQGISIAPVEVTNEGYTLVLLMPDYYTFVDSGRKGSSKLPPLEPIEDWISRRGIRVELVKKVKTKSGSFYKRTFRNSLEWRNSVAWGIRKTVAKHGYISKGHGFYSEIVNDELINELVQTLLTNSGEVFTAQITDI